MRLDLEIKNVYIWIRGTLKAAARCVGRHQKVRGCLRDPNFRKLAYPAASNCLRRRITIIYGQLKYSYATDVRKSAQVAPVIRSSMIFPAVAVLSRLELCVAQLPVQLLQNFGQGGAHQLGRNLAAIAQPGAVLYPLPDLRAADFGGGGIFHQIIKRHAAISGEPACKVLQTDDRYSQRRPASVTLPGGSVSKSCAATFTSSRFRVKSDSGSFHARIENIAWRWELRPEVLQLHVPS